MEKLNNKDWLYTEYVINNRSCESIATELGTYRHRVRRALIKNGIPIKSQSAAQIAALKSERATHPTKGKKRPESVKLLISEGVAKKWAEATEEELAERSDKCRQRWEAMSEETRAQLVRAGREAVLRAAKEGSKLEKYLRKGLTEAGHVIEYHQERLLPAGERLHIDLFLPRLSTAIEIDGPSHFYPIWGEEQLRKTMESDEKKTGLLLSAGIVILRIKHTQKSLSQKVQRDILNAVLRQLDKISREYPERTNQLIELEV